MPVSCLVGELSCSHTHFLNIIIKTFIDLRNSLAIIKVLLLNLKKSPLRVKGFFTHSSVTPVSELSCSPTHDRYANSIFRYNQGHRTVNVINFPF